MRKYLSRIKRKVVDSWTNQEGVAAVEFALISPLLILLFLGTVETSYAVSIDRKLSRTASAIADLITQSSDLTGADVDDLMDIADNIMAPYGAVPCIVVTGITINSGQAKVDWSRDNSSETASGDCQAKGDLTEIARVKRAPGTDFPVPDAIKIDGSFLVAAEIEIDHKPIVGFFTYDGDGSGSTSHSTTPITLSDRILLRPRIGDSVNIN